MSTYIILLYKAQNVKMWTKMWTMHKTAKTVAQYTKKKKQTLHLVWNTFCCLLFDHIN